MARLGPDVVDKTYNLLYYIHTTTYLYKTTLGNERVRSFSRVEVGGGGCQEELPSKTSKNTLVFEGRGGWWWLPRRATLGNERIRSFSRVVWSRWWLPRRATLENERTCSFSR